VLTGFSQLKQSLSTAEQAFEEVVTEKKELENKLANPLEEIKAIGVENDKLIEQASHSMPHMPLTCQS
jgi:regulator of replication initiation timing